MTKVDRSLTKSQIAIVAGTFATSGNAIYFDLTAAASSARFFCHELYSGVPGRGGTSFGIPPSHIGTWSATVPPTLEAQADSIMQAMAAKAGLVTFNFMVPFRALITPRTWPMPHLLPNARPF